MFGFHKKEKSLKIHHESTLFLDPCGEISSKNTPRSHRYCTFFVKDDQWHIVSHPPFVVRIGRVPTAPNEPAPLESGCTIRLYSAKETAFTFHPGKIRKTSRFGRNRSTASLSHAKHALLYFNRENSEAECRKVFDSTVLGKRDECDIQITANPHICGRHCLFLRKDSQWYIEMYHKGHAVVNGEFLSPGNTAPLPDGSEIKFPGTEGVYVFREVQ